MPTIEQPLRHAAELHEAKYQAMLALPRIAAALEKLTNPFGQPITAFTPEEAKAFLHSVEGDNIP